jgi:hypothetical protein
MTVPRTVWSEYVQRTVKIHPASGSPVKRLALT